MPNATARLLKILPTVTAAVFMEDNCHCIE